MHRRFLRTVAAGSAVAASIMTVAALPPAPAGAAPAVPAPSALVRVEGAGATLLSQTLVQTTFADSVAGHPCQGTSTAGALNDATSGHWSGSYSTKYNDFLVSSILGETPSGNNYWTLFVNGRASSTGACGTPVHPGDHVLWFDCVADANFNCTNNPLALSGPAVARRGRRLTVHVSQIDGNGHSSPMTGAAVGGTGVSGVSGAGGSATVTPRTAGIITIQATKTGSTPSDPMFLCVYVHTRAECGRAGRGPTVRITDIKNGARYRRAHAPRELTGTAGPDPSGLTDISFSLTRSTSAKRCSYYDADRARFVSRGCRGEKPAPSFTLGASGDWSYLLPARLEPGHYELVVTATDGANRTGGAVVSFTVR